jgi:hypothetical protein
MYYLYKTSPMLEPLKSLNKDLFRPLSFGTMTIP